MQASIYSMCATDGCPRRARGRVPGSLCKPCKLAAGHPAAACLTKGCARIRARQGLCEPCFLEGKPALPPRPRHLGPRSETCEIGGCELKPNNRCYLCGKHAINRNACLTRGCAAPSVAAGLCDKHRPGAQGTCSVQRCPCPRFKAGFCYRHHRERKPARCARKGCPNSTASTYCRTHDVGIDFAAGDWHDWVAVEQLWDGSLNPARKPTIPELEVVFDRAERKGMGYVALAHQLRADKYLVRSWCDILGRLREVVAA